MSTPIARRRDARAAGLIGAYALNSRQAHRSTDASGRGNSGAMTARHGRRDGRFGGALRFDGGGDAVRVPASQSLDLTQAMTLSAWIRPSRSAVGLADRPPPADRRVLPRCRRRALGENTIGGVDDARAVLAAAAIAWLCVALAGGSAQGLKAHVGPWWAHNRACFSPGRFSTRPSRPPGRRSRRRSWRSGSVCARPVGRRPRSIRDRGGVCGRDGRRARRAGRERSGERPGRHLSLRRARRAVRPDRCVGWLHRRGARKRSDVPDYVVGPFSRGVAREQLRLGVLPAERARDPLPADPAHATSRRRDRRGEPTRRRRTHPCRCTRRSAPLRRPRRAPRGGRRTRSDSPTAMYSRILFIVETSLSGLWGSGASATSAVDRMPSSSSSGIRPVNVTWSSRPSSLASARISSKQSPGRRTRRASRRAGRRAAPRASGARSRRRPAGP